MYLQVVNECTDATTIRVEGSDLVPEAERLAVDFGMLAPGQSSSYKEVNASFFVYTDDVLFERAGGSGPFSVDHLPTPHWILILRDNGGWDLAADFDI